MNYKLNKVTSKYVKANIKTVLRTGRPWSDDQKHIPLQTLYDILETIPGLEVVNTDSSGWQWDYRVECTHEDKSYILGGSGAYGGISFSLKEEEKGDDSGEQ